MGKYLHRRNTVRKSASISTSAVWHNFSGGPDTAEDYYATYQFVMGQYPEALLFVNWLYNHSSVLHERAEIIKCAEMLMQEDDFEICESILRQQEKLRERIDETLSEKIVQKCRNMNGEYIWPWILPFSAAGHETYWHTVYQ